MLVVISWCCVQNHLLHTAAELSKQYVWHHAYWVWQQYIVWLFILLQAVSGTLSDCSWELPVTHSLVLFSTCSHFTVFSKQYLKECFSSLLLTCMAASGFRMNLWAEPQWIFQSACHLFSPLCLKSHSLLCKSGLPPSHTSPPLFTTSLPKKIKNDTNKKLGKPILIK